MTEDIRTLLREDVLRDEPPSTLSSSRAVAAGRRRRRARGAGAILASTAILAAAVVSAPTVIDAVSADEPAPAGRPDYDPAQMPGRIKSAVNNVVSTTAPEFNEVKIQAWTGEMPGSEREWNRLNKDEWGKASYWDATFLWRNAHLLKVQTVHDPDNGDEQENYCRGTYNGKIDRSRSRLADGTVICTSTWPVGPRRRGWWQAYRGYKPDITARWFVRQTTVYPGGNVAVNVREAVEAPTLSAAKQKWYLDARELSRIAADGDLWFPGEPIMR